MTRHDDANGIGAIRQTDGPHRLRTSDLHGKRSVRNGGANGNVSQFIPDATLKCRAGRLYRYIVYRFDAAGKVSVNRSPQAMRIANRRKVESVFSVMQPQQA